MKLALRYCLCFILLSFLFSCEKEYSFEGRILNPGTPPADTTIPVIPPANPDHFPLTSNSFWVYDDLSYPGDSIVWTITGDSSLNNTSHRIFTEYKSFFPATNKYYFTRTGADYLRYIYVSAFTSAFNYSPSIYGDINFLKENLSTGDTWYSDTWSGRTSLIIQFVTLRYQFRCIDADATVTINGKTFKHVYKVQMIPEEADVGSPVVPTGEIHISYYAQGIGLIYSEFYNGILTHPVMQIRRWQVN